MPTILLLVRVSVLAAAASQPAPTPTTQEGSPPLVFLYFPQGEFVQGMDYPLVVEVQNRSSEPIVLPMPLLGEFAGGTGSRLDAHGWRLHVYVQPADTSRALAVSHAGAFGTRPDPLSIPPKETRLIKVSLDHGFFSPGKNKVRAVLCEEGVPKARDEGTAEFLMFGK